MEGEEGVEGVEGVENGGVEWRGWNGGCRGVALAMLSAVFSCLHALTWGTLVLLVFLHSSAHLLPSAHLLSCLHALTLGTSPLLACLHACMR